MLAKGVVSIERIDRVGFVRETSTLWLKSDGYVWGRIELVSLWLGFVRLR